MRRFEFVEGTSAKFWMAEVQGATFTVVYGRLGTGGQRKEKVFPDEQGARREYERKVAEKLREGYREVGGEAPPVPSASPRQLPPRVRGGRPSAGQVAEAVEALTALEALLGQRSWKVARQAGRARRALRALGGVDPSSQAALGPVLASLLDRVVAPPGSPRLPLWAAMGLLAELDASAFSQALARWKGGPAGGPAQAALQALARQAEALGEPELALRAGLLLASEEGWARRWEALRPHLEGHLVAAGSSLPAWLRGLEAGGDVHLAARLSRLGA